MVPGLSRSVNGRKNNESRITDKNIHFFKGLCHRLINLKKENREKKLMFQVWCHHTYTKIQKDWAKKNRRILSIDIKKARSFLYHL